MRKQFVAWFFVAAAVAVLLSLSVWQFRRLAWKETLMVQYEAAEKAEPVAIASLAPFGPEDEFRKVILTGEWVRDKELHLGGRRYKTETGYQILAPLHTPEGVYLINRGWVPTAQKDAARPLPEGEVTLAGVLRFPRAARMFTPANHPEKNFWFTIDIPAMEKATGLDLADITVDLRDTGGGERDTPIPPESNAQMRNDHLEYALTWLMLAVAAGVVGWLRLKRSAA